MRSDTNLVLAALAVGRVVADTALVPAYAQCGGISWTYGFDCEEGYSCVPGASTTIPDYLCEPTGGPYKYPALNYAQCGGQNFVGPTVCTTGWHCQFQNDFHSQCLKDDTFVIPPRPVDYPWPTFKAPGDKCGDDKVGPPFDPCTPGYSCKFSGLWTWWVCLADDKPISSATAATTKATTTSVYYPPTSTVKTTSVYEPPTSTFKTTSVVPTTPVKSTTKATTTGKTTATTTVKTTTQTTTAPLGAPLWGQCGGISWTGPVTCIAPAVCKVANTWFSQCLLA